MSCGFLAEFVLNERHTNGTLDEIKGCGWKHCQARLCTWRPTTFLEEQLAHREDHFSELLCNVLPPARIDLPSADVFVPTHECNGGTPTVDEIHAIIQPLKNNTYLEVDALLPEVFK